MAAVDTSDSSSYVEYSDHHFSPRTAVSAPSLTYAEHSDEHSRPITASDSECQVQYSDGHFSPRTAKYQNLPEIVLTKLGNFVPKPFRDESSTAIPAKNENESNRSNDLSSGSMTTAVEYSLDDESMKMVTACDLSEISSHVEPIRKKGNDLKTNESVDSQGKRQNLESVFDMANDCVYGKESHATKEADIEGQSMSSSSIGSSECENWRAWLKYMNRKSSFKLPIVDLNKCIEYGEWNELLAEKSALLQIRKSNEPRSFYELHDLNDGPVDDGLRIAFVPSQYYLDDMKEYRSFDSVPNIETRLLINRPLRPTVIQSEYIMQSEQ